ncbi:MAG: calcium-binding protein, partial [Pseudomonadota bacterium]
FVANANGEFTVLVGSSGSATGSYGLFIEQLDLIGDAFSNGLKGTSGDDTLIPGAGDDTIDGGGGLDVVVFDGDRADFEISVGGSIFGSSSSTNPVTVSNENEGSDTVRNVETLRFNDQDVSILEFLDDIPEGTTRSLKFTKFGKLKSFGFSEKGRIDAIGDTDVFSVDLEEGDVFGVSIESADFFLRFEEEFGEESSPANELTIESVLDPSGDPIELVSDTSVDDEIGEVSFFRAAQAGTYLFTVAGVDEFVGDYQLDLQNALQTGDENSNFLIATPLDDTINGGAGEDQILFFGGGTDFIDGGADEDTISLSFELNELSLSVSDDDVITFTSALGTFDVINVENFIFDDFSEESSDEQSFDDLKELASVAPDAEPVTILLGDDDPDDLDGGNGNNVINSGAGDDEITDTGGDNNIDAGEGEDKVGLISGSNTVDGGADADLIIGGIGNDDLSGGDGNDIIRGDVSTNLFGSDTITGGAGDDLLEGRGGQDTFVFNPNNGDNTIGALDIDFDTPANTTVTGADFVAGVDLVSLVGFGLADADAAFALVSDVDGVATFADQSTTITFAGLTTADLSADDFVVAIDELL